MKKKGVLIAWAYIVEWLAALLIFALLLTVFGSAPISRFMSEVAIDVATLFGGGMLAASIGFLWTFYSKADTEFYCWLDQRDALSAYLNAAVYVVAVAFFATTLPLILKVTKPTEFALFVAFYEILALLNFYSLVKNVTGLMRLNARFNQIRSQTELP